MLNLTRRKFLETSSIVAAGLVANTKGFAGASVPAMKPFPICIFSKCLQFLNYNQLGETVARLGFGGADLSVRKGGHVLPADVKVNLPKAIKALKKSGVEVPMMVTDINSADSPDVEKVLGTASELGITHYRMGYLSYDAGKSIKETLDVHKRSIEKLEKINRKFGIHGEYQNHSGNRVGGPVWDIYWMLKDSDPAHIGCQYDIRHAVCEGAYSWPTGMKLLAPWIKSTAIKDFYWIKENTKWEIKDVALGEGMVNFDAYLTEYVKLGINGPVSIHCEYDLGGAENGRANPTMSHDEIFALIKKDLDWLKNKFKDNAINPGNL